MFEIARDYLLMGEIKCICLLDDVFNYFKQKKIRSDLERRCREAEEARRNIINLDDYELVEGINPGNEAACMHCVHDQYDCNNCCLTQPTYVRK